MVRLRQFCFALKIKQINDFILCLENFVFLAKLRQQTDGKKKKQTNTRFFSTKILLFLKERNNNKKQKNISMSKNDMKYSTTLLPPKKNVPLSNVCLGSRTHETKKKKKKTKHKTQNV